MTLLDFIFLDFCGNFQTLDQNFADILVLLFFCFGFHSIITEMGFYEVRCK